MAASSRWCTRRPRRPRTGRRARSASVARRGEEERGAEAVGVLRTEALEVVLTRYVDAPRPELGIGQRGVDEVAALDSDHAARDAVADEIDRDVREGDRDGLVEGVGVAAAQVVGQLARAGLLPRARADLVGQRLGDVRLVPVPERVSRAVFRDRAAL